MSHDRIHALRAEIRRHDQLYYSLGRPSISDTEYDKLFRELRDLEATHGLDDVDSPTQRVGGKPIDGFQAVAHTMRMRSIENVFTDAELDAWMAKGPQPGTNVFVEYKVDGLAVALHYSGGRLIRAVTRGDGDIGDDVTHAAYACIGVPHKIAEPGDWEVRGELFIGDADFLTYRHSQISRGEEPYTNSRAAAVGAIRSLDPAAAFERKVRFVAYNLLGSPAASHHAVRGLLQHAGFPIVPGRQSSSEELNATLQELMPASLESDIPVDGLVVKVDSLARQRELGETSRDVRWAVAYKWERYEAETTVRGITNQVGRTGVITPVAELAPVEIAGTTVARASLFNFPMIAQLDLRVGDRVIVEKAGKIIPHIVRVLVEQRPQEALERLPEEAPAVCPVCGAGTLQEGDTKAVRCPNADCPAVIQTTLRQFASRGGMDIFGMGESLIEQLHAAGLLNELLDVYRLPEKLKATTIPGIGVKTVNKLVAGIAASKLRPLANVLFALGIRSIGANSSVTLASRYGTLPAVAAACAAGTAGLGEQTDRQLMAYFGSARAEELVAYFVSQDFACCKPPVSTAAQAHRPFLGMSVVVTGTLANYDRNQAKDAIRALGGTPSDSVSRKTGYLVVGADPGSKLDKAKALGVPVLSDQGFEDVVGGGQPQPIKPEELPSRAPPAVKRN